MHQPDPTGPPSQLPHTRSGVYREEGGDDEAIVRVPGEGVLGRNCTRSRRLTGGIALSSHPGL